MCRRANVSNGENGDRSVDDEEERTPSEKREDDTIARLRVLMEPLFAIETNDMINYR